MTLSLCLGPWERKPRIFWQICHIASFSSTQELVPLLEKHCAQGCVSTLKNIGFFSVIYCQDDQDMVWEHTQICLDAHFGPIGTLSALQELLTERIHQRPWLVHCFFVSFKRSLHAKWRNLLMLKTCSFSCSQTLLIVMKWPVHSLRGGGVPMQVCPTYFLQFPVNAKSCSFLFGICPFFSIAVSLDLIFYIMLHVCTKERTVDGHACEAVVQFRGRWRWHQPPAGYCWACFCDLNKRTLPLFRASSAPVYS